MSTVGWVTKTLRKIHRLVSPTRLPAAYAIIIPIHVPWVPMSIPRMSIPLNHILHLTETQLALLQRGLIVVLVPIRGCLPGVIKFNVQSRVVAVVVCFSGELWEREGEGGGEAGEE